MKILLALIFSLVAVGCATKLSAQCEGKCNIDVDRQLELPK